eukprot:CAMPEP_0184310886 /NCGR_PEP_ID=MMETSP1049-20130417/35739_1 /TAXON_ID=77928 /ORGANISM="Proteomonas sulcata, Strain CCMP704" /LENGTH=110 /DNA_ID=CAMNT_0026625659 /DNA_START=237 /DNA_END=565 /DNA_ORIENTATION=-
MSTALSLLCDATRGKLNNLVQKGTSEVVDTLDPVAEEVKLLNAIVHSLHVLEDVRPGVRTGAEGRHVARRGLGDSDEAEVLVGLGASSMKVTRVCLRRAGCLLENGEHGG